MPAVDVLCLAFSMKHGGRCIAGVRLDSGAWVRPVSAAEDGTLMPAACALDVGRSVRPLDIVRLPMIEARPAPHQPENWVVAPGPWSLIEERTMQSAAVDLAGIADGGPMLLGTPGKSISWESIEANGVPASLGLVRVAAPSFVVNEWRRFFALTFITAGSTTTCHARTSRRGRRTPTRLGAFVPSRTGTSRSVSASRGRRQTTATRSSPPVSRYRGRELTAPLDQTRPSYSQDVFSFR